MDRFAFELWQGGILVAEVEASTLDQARREIMHYAVVDAQDGPCQIRGANVAAVMPATPSPTEKQP